MEDRESREKGIARQPAGRSAAVRKSHTTAAVCFRSRCYFASRASRKSRLSGWNPAAFNTARATFKNSGQPEATPTRAAEGAGKYGASEAGTERSCRNNSSAPGGSSVRAIAARLGNTAGMSPSGVFGQSSGSQDSTGNVTARAISAARMRRNSSSGSINKKWFGGCRDRSAGNVTPSVCAERKSRAII